MHQQTAQLSCIHTWSDISIMGSSVFCINDDVLIKAQPFHSEQLVKQQLPNTLLLRALLWKKNQGGSLGPLAK